MHCLEDDRHSNIGSRLTNLDVARKKTILGTKKL